jgi:hypothetical protein
MRLPRFVALNSKISVATRSVTPPLKSAQARKMFSVTVIAPSPGQLAHKEAGTNIVEGLGRRGSGGWWAWPNNIPEMIPRESKCAHGVLPLSPHSSVSLQAYPRTGPSYFLQLGPTFLEGRVRLARRKTLSSGKRVLWPQINRNIDPCCSRGSGQHYCGTQSLWLQPPWLGPISLTPRWSRIRVTVPGASFVGILRRELAGDFPSVRLLHATYVKLRDVVRGTASRSRTL